MIPESHITMFRERTASHQTTGGDSSRFIEQLRKIAESENQRDSAETRSEKRSREFDDTADARRQTIESNERKEMLRTANRTFEDSKHAEKTAIDKIERRELRAKEFGIENRGMRRDNSIDPQNNTKNPDPVTRLPLPSATVSIPIATASSAPGVGSMTPLSSDTGGIATPPGATQGLQSVSGHQAANYFQPAFGYGPQPGANAFQPATNETTTRGVTIESLIFGAMPLVSQQPIPKKLMGKNGATTESDEQSDQSSTAELGDKSSFGKELAGVFANKSVSDSRASSLPGGVTTKSILDGQNRHSGTDNVQMNPAVASAFREAEEMRKQFDKQESETKTEIDFAKKLHQNHIQTDVDSVSNPNLITESERRQLLKRISAVVRSGGTQGGVIRMKLAPESLGSLNLTIRQSGGKIRVKLEVESDSTRRLLLEGLDELRAILKKNDVEIESFEVESPNSNDSDEQDKENENDLLELSVRDTTDT